MSRHGVTYKPGGAIAKPLDMAIKMRRETPSSQAAQCNPNPTGLFWFNDATSAYDQSVVTGSVDNYAGWTAPVPQFFYSARLEGELCGRERDVVLTATWLNSTFNNSDYGPMVWTSGANLTVSPYLSGAYSAQLDPGILTVIATLDGVQIGAPITLVITLAGGYY